MDNRTAALALMGSIYGQAKDLDQKMEGSSALKPLSHHVAGEFERVLRTPQGPVPFIPPTPEEVGRSGVLPPVLPPQPQQHAYAPPQAVPAAPIPQPEVYYPPQPTYAAAPLPPQTGYHDFTDPRPAPVLPSLDAQFMQVAFELLRRLDIIEKKLDSISLKNGRQVKRKKRTVSNVSGSSSEG